MESTNKHVLLISAPFYGHVFPLLELARRISQIHHVTFAVSPTILKNVQKMVESEGKNEKPIMSFVEIQDGMTATDADLNSSSMRTIWSSIIPATREFLRNLTSTKEQETETVVRNNHENNLQNSVDVVICDNFLSGPASVCHERKIPYYLFSTASAWLQQCFLTLDIEEPVDFNVEMKDSPFSRPSIGRKFLSSNVEKNKDLLLDFEKTTHLADGLIFSGPREIEEAALQEIFKSSSVTDLKIFCVGPLIPEKKRHSENSQQNLTNDFVLKWLNAKEARSVVYVSFGSIFNPAPEQLMELATAFVELGQPFVWSLRADQHQYLPLEIQDNLEKSPECDSPFLILPWLPQQEILSHTSTGIFLSHCGWNSTLESLTFGVPVVGWPMFSDQLQNALWIEDHLVGKCVRGTGIRHARHIPAKEIVEILRGVGGWAFGEINDFRQNAQRWAATIKDALEPNGSSSSDLQKLLQFVKKSVK